MEKIKIVFDSYGKKETVTVDLSDYFNRMLGKGKFNDCGITVFNSQLVEVYMQNPNDKRKWYLWKKITNETYPIPENKYV